MMPILYQGSGNTIGDLLFSSHVHYHQHTLGREIHAAIPKSLNPELKHLYAKHNYLKSVVEMDDISTIPFLSYCVQNGYESSLHIIDMKFYSNIMFHPLHEWLPYDHKPTIEPGAVGFHVSSSAHYNRPIIPHLETYLIHCWNNNIKTIFMGSTDDEKLFMRSYPWICNYAGFISDECWRFGRDSILQTMANLKTLLGLVVFSSWTGPAATLQGTPTIELWNDGEWQFYSPLVAQMVGKPVHYIQVCYLDKPSQHLTDAIFPKLKQYATNFYQWSG